MESCCPAIQGLPLVATVLPPPPGTTLREEPTSSPGRAAPLSPRPPYHPALPAPFTAKAGKDPSGHGQTGQSQSWEQRPSVAAGSVPLSASLLSCRHLRPEKKSQEQTNLSHPNNPPDPQCHRTRGRPLKTNATSGELTFTPKPGVRSAMPGENWKG